jgi:2-oxoglutarate dehydrogenase E2 component (dihydrolipoamide succinyltransferase)
MDAPVVEVATDKVDSEIPSPGTGVLKKILSVVGDIPKVGQVIGLISTGADTREESGPEPDHAEDEVIIPDEGGPGPGGTHPERDVRADTAGKVFETGKLTRYSFLSPVIRKMARDHGIPPAEMERVKGTGLGNRITRADLLAYLKDRKPEDPDNERAATAPPSGRKSGVIAAMERQDKG